MVFSMAVMPITVGSCLICANTSSNVAQQISCICSPSKYRCAAMSWNDPISPCIAILFIFLIKIPLSLCCEAGLYFFLFFHCLFLHTAFRFTGCCKVKIKAVKVSIQHVHCLDIFVYRLQKYNFSANSPNNLKEILRLWHIFVTFTHPSGTKDPQALP